MLTLIRSCDCSFSKPVEVSFGNVAAILVDVYSNPVTVFFSVEVDFVCVTGISVGVDLTI